MPRRLAFALLAALLPACSSVIIEEQGAASTGSTGSASSGDGGSGGTGGAPGATSSTNATGATSSTSTGAPLDDTPIYSAVRMSDTTGFRYSIFKVEPASDRCTRLLLGSGDLNPSYEGEIGLSIGWSITRIEITPHASDCALSAGEWPPSAEAVQAQSGGGSILHDKTGIPCNTFVDVTLSFPGGGWNPAIEALDAQLALQNSPCSGNF